MQLVLVMIQLELEKPLQTNDNQHTPMAIQLKFVCVCVNKYSQESAKQMYIAGLMNWRFNHNTAKGQQVQRGQALKVTSFSTGFKKENINDHFKNQFQKFHCKWQKSL